MTLHLQCLVVKISGIWDYIYRYKNIETYLVVVVLFYPFIGFEIPKMRPKITAWLRRHILGTPALAISWCAEGLTSENPKTVQKSGCLILSVRVPMALMAMKWIISA